MTTLIHAARKLDADGQVDDFWMLIDGDTIIHTGSGPVPEPQLPPGIERVDAGGNWLVPGFIDLHGHGGGGHTFDSDNPDEVLAGVATHRSHGTTRSVISLVSNPLEQLRASLGLIADLADTDPTILGSHLEGPFLADARRGAHNPAHLISPTPKMLDELVEASSGTLRQMTIAPELDGALDAIDALVGAGVTVAIGHTEADAGLSHEAFDRGARILTHAFNAMNGIGHRAPGPIVAAFADGRVTIELILDGHHVHPDVAAMTFRAAPGRIALITDAMAAAGGTDGDYQLGSLDVTVRGGLATLRGTDSIAGSTLTLDAAVRNAVKLSGVPLGATIASVTAVPAHALGLDDRLGYLKPGYAADAVVLDADLRPVRVWANGTTIPAEISSGTRPVQ